MFNIASYQEGYQDGYSDAKAFYEKKIEVIHIHQLAKPDDVKDIDFPGTSRENK